MSKKFSEINGPIESLSGNFSVGNPWRSGKITATSTVRAVDVVGQTFLLEALVLGVFEPYNVRMTKSEYYLLLAEFPAGGKVQNEVVVLGWSKRAARDVGILADAGELPRLVTIEEVESDGVVNHQIVRA